MSVNGYQINIYTYADIMYQASLVSRSLPWKDFSFACGESLGTTVYQATHVRNKDVKVIHADNCKRRRAPAYTESSE